MTADQDWERRESARLDALKSYDVLDTAPEHAFDRVTRIAKGVFDAPIALVSLVDAERQWFKSKQGLEADETTRAISFCSHAIEGTSTFIVQDALEDPRFSDNPLVKGPPCVRFYAGAPLRTPDGYNLGTLCVIDTTPRRPSDQQIGMLEELARMTVETLETRRLARIDRLTGALSRRAFDERAGEEFSRAQRYRRDLACVMLQIDGFDGIAEAFGPDAADETVRRVAEIARRRSRRHETVGRLDRCVFAVIAPETDCDNGFALAERLRASVEEAAIAPRPGAPAATISCGVAELHMGDGWINDVTSRAREALDEAMREGGDVCRAAGPDPLKADDAAPGLDPSLLRRIV